MKKIIVLLLSCFVALSGHSQTESTEKKKCRLFKRKNKTEAAKVNSDNPKYRLAISFISIGTGTDAKAFKSVDSLLSKQSKKLVCVDQPWGREGELDKYFMLDELSSKEQKSLISKLKKLCEGNQMVIISENVENQRKRR
jgi:hypothetical protein